METIQAPFWNQERLFQLFKYVIYGLIFFNVCVFMAQDMAASAVTFKDGVTFANASDAFATFMDSLAWFFLLIIFELETYTMDDDQLRGKRKMLLNILAAICYFFIVMAFLGYYNKSEMIHAFTEVPIKDLCALVGGDISIATTLDEYEPLSAANCNSLTSPLFYHSESLLYADAAVLDQMKKLSMLDVVNAFTWLVVVVVLQIEVILQLRGALTTYLYKLNSVIKIISYLILFIACIIWGYLGAFIDFWDAFLWLAAFIFIELNIFQWRQEGAEKELAR